MTTRPQNDSINYSSLDLDVSSQEILDFLNEIKKTKALRIEETYKWRVGITAAAFLAFILSTYTSSRLFFLTCLVLIAVSWLYLFKKSVTAHDFSRSARKRKFARENGLRYTYRFDNRNASKNKSIQNLYNVMTQLAIYRMRSSITEIYDVVEGFSNSTMYFEIRKERNHESIDYWTCIGIEVDEDFPHLIYFSAQYMRRVFSMYYGKRVSISAIARILGSKDVASAFVAESLEGNPYIGACDSDYYEALTDF